MNGKSWEQEAVDEIIAKEQRMDDIYRQMSYLEYLQFEAELYGDRTTWFAEKLEDLESELSDLQSEVGHE